MANLITRGFGALQRIVTRGFYSGNPPTPDCYTYLASKINDDAAVVAGKITGFVSLVGRLDESVSLVSYTVLHGKIGETEMISGKITEFTVTKGGLCCGSTH